MLFDSIKRGLFSRPAIILMGLILSGFSVAYCADDCDDQINIELKKQVTIPFGIIKLGQIAHITGQEEGAKRAREISLGTIMSSAQSLRYSAKALLVYLRGAGFEDSEINFSGQEIAEIFGEASQNLSADHLVGEIENAVYQAAALAYPDMVISVVIHQPLPSVFLDKTEIIRIDEIRIPQRGGDIGFGVSVSGNGTSGRALIRARVDLHRNCWVAIRPIGRGETFSAQDFSQELISASRILNPVDDMEKLEGAIALRPIQAGQALDQGFFRLPPLISRGETVTVLFKKGNLHLEGIGEALGDGTKGQMISVKLKSTGKVLRCTAISKGIVEFR